MSIVNAKNEFFNPTDTIKISKLINDMVLLAEGSFDNLDTRTGNLLIDYLSFLYMNVLRSFKYVGFSSNGKDTYYCRTKEEYEKWVESQTLVRGWIDTSKEVYDCKDNEYYAITKDECPSAYLNAESAMTIIGQYKEAILKIQQSLKYIGEYYYIDPMGSIFSNENEWRTICYGNTKEECEKYCRSLGYVKSKDLFDGGYSVSKNPNFYKE